MKRLICLFIFLVMITTLSFAYETNFGPKKTSRPIVEQGKSISEPSASSAKTAHKTVFNHLSDYFASFNRPFQRPGNKQGYWQAAADWVRNLPN